jgi:predicted solute-binding protein
MRLAVWPLEPARALGAALAGHVSSVIEVEPWEAASSLAEGRCDLALVPTLEVLRTPASFDVVPSVALAGDTSPSLVLVVGTSLDRVRTLAFDPRYAQEALLAALLLREHYGAEPTFAADDPAASLASRLEKHDAALVQLALSHDLPPGAVALDLGTEWMDLTTRPFVWGLLVARGGELTGVDARKLAGAARAAVAPAEWQFTLAGYGHEGLVEFAGHLFFHGALKEVPELSFVDGAAPAAPELN